MPTQRPLGKESTRAGPVHTWEGRMCWGEGGLGEDLQAGSEFAAWAQASPLHNLTMANPAQVVVKMEAATPGMSS